MTNTPTYTSKHPVWLLHIEFGGTHYPFFSVHETRQEAEAALRDRALDELETVAWGVSAPTIEDLVEKWADFGTLARIHRCTGWGNSEVDLPDGAEQSFNEFWKRQQRLLGLEV